MKHRIDFLLILVPLIIGCASDPYNRFKGRDLHLMRGDKELFWFSGIHSNDPDHEMFGDLEKAFVRFAPDIVLVEGGAEQQSYSDPEQAILHGGESGFVTYLSRLSGIPVQSIEPSWEDQFAHLLAEYKAEDVLTMYLFRQLNQYQREAKIGEFDLSSRMLGYTRRMLERGFPLPGREIDGSYLVSLVEPYVNFSVGDFNWNSIPAKEIIYFSDTLPHRIWKDTIRFRDKYAVRLISGLMKDYDRIFVMMGADHIENQREELEALFGNQ